MLRSIFPYLSQQITNSGKLSQSLKVYNHRILSLTPGSASFYSTLHELAESGDGENLQKELKSGLNQLHNYIMTVQGLVLGISPDVQDARKWTPLMIAASQGHLNIIKILIGHGSDLEIKNRTGQTALELSAFYNKKSAYELLKSHNSKSDTGFNESFSILNPVESNPLWTGIDRCVDLRTDKSVLNKLIENSSTVFTIFYSGWPVTISNDKTGDRTVLKLGYSEIKSYVDPDQFVFLGRARKDGDTFTDGAIPNNENSSAYFAVDVSAHDKSFLKKLSPTAEILSRINFLFVKGFDKKLVEQARPILDWHKRHAYCAVCSYKTKLSDAGYKRVCTNEKCSTNADIDNTSYPRVDPTVISPVISSDGRRVLLGRKEMFPPGMYSCLAGFVEPGESLEQACAREIKEEVGVSVSSIRYHSSQTWPMPCQLMVGFMCYVSNDQQPLRIDRSELEDARWFDRDEVILMQTLLHPDALFTPPVQAIAHRLIKTWLLETAFKF